MTREEAIEFGKMWLEMQEDCKESDTYEFFKMAIESLEQEPTYTSEIAQKAYEDGKKDGYMQRKIETIAEKESKDDYVDRKEVKKIAKEMYLEVANMKLNIKTISDCISYTASKCREVLERKLQALTPVKPQETVIDKIRKEIKKLPITDTAIRLVDEVFDKYMEKAR